MVKKCRVLYSLYAFHRAISAYRDKIISSAEASKKFDVPENTIRKRQNSTNNRLGSSRPSLLSNEEEKYLAVLLEGLQ